MRARRLLSRKQIQPSNQLLTPSQTENPKTMSRRLPLLLLLLGYGVFSNWERIDHWLHPPPHRTFGPHKVVLYATEWCGYCAKTRKYFAENGIDYRELDIENSPEGQKDYERLGGGGVPIVLVDDERVIRGYDPELLKEALSASP